MKKSLSTLALVVLISSSIGNSYAASVVRAGASCAKLGATAKVGTKTLKCVKVGTRSVWKTSSSISSSPTPSVTPTATPTPSVTPTPAFTPATAPTSFDDLFQNRKGISYAAWLRVSESVKNNSSKLGVIEVTTGPNTVAYFNDDEKALGLVSRAFASAGEPKRVVFIRYQFKDLQWAESEIRKFINQQEYDELNRNEGGRLLSSNCDSAAKNCEGSKQNTTQSGLALILQGVPNGIDPWNPVGRERMTTGMLEAHEYFHAIQRIPLNGKPAGPGDWPRAWIREGSAEWVQNVVINSNNYDKYQQYIHTDCSNPVANLSESEIIEFFTASDDEQINRKFDPWLNYCLGAYGVEALVSLKGQESIISLYLEMATRIGFNAAFKNVYGIEPEKALTQVAKAIYANINRK